MGILKRLAFLVIIACLSMEQASWAGGKTELTWYGHAAFKIVTPTGHVLFIDPWLVNPANPKGQTELDQISKADLILVSHGHFDHVGNAVEIAKATKARLVTTYDLGNAMATYGCFPKEQMGFDSLGNFGGTVHFFNDEVQVTFVPAIHSSAVTVKNAGAADTYEYAGNPGGFLITLKNGPTIYHTGDTDLFGDMALLPKYRPIDIMLTCIGDHFTMGPGGAAEAVALVKPAKVIPMHYGTFPNVLTGTVADFKKSLAKQNMTKKLNVLEIGVPKTF